MNIQHLRNRNLGLLIIVLCTIVLTGCVSLNVPKDEPVKSTTIRTAAPGGNFQPLKIDDLDNAWKNQTNGNTISYLSNCNDPSDPSLKSIRTEIIARIEDAEIAKESMIKFNQRGALRSNIKGMVEGLGTFFDVVILKKNNCIYIINYVGTEKSYSEDLDHFNEFLKGFTIR